MSDINELLSKVAAIFLSNPEFLTLTRLNIGAACCNEAVYSPKIVAVGWLVPLPRSDNPSQVVQLLWTCQTSMMCCQKSGQILIRSWNSRPEPSRCQCTMMVWGTVFTNDCCSRLDGSITKVWQHFTSNIHTLGTCQTSMMCGQKVRPDSCEILKFLPWTK